MKFSSIRAIGFAALLVAASGCSEMLTYSQDAKREGRREFNDGRYAQAEASFRNAIRQNPADPDSEYWLGMSCEAGKDYHQAIDAYKICLKLMPKPNMNNYNAVTRADAFDRLAHVVASVDNSNSEIDLILKEASTDQSAEMYRLAGRVFRYRGDADSALDQYHHAITNDPENFQTQKELGLYLVQLTQNQEAGITLRDAYRLNSNDNEVNGALRQIGMVPGPGLLAQDKLVKPIMPELNSPMPASGTMAPTPIDPQPRN